MIHLSTEFFPFTCPHCEMSASVALRGQAPFLLRHCHHAVAARRDIDTKRIVVDFAADMDAPDAASE